MTSRYGVFSPPAGEGVFSASQPSTPRLAVVNEGGSTITDRRTIRLNRPWLNDNEPSSVPRAAARISFESMPKD